MKRPIICYSVKTTIHIDTNIEYIVHDRFDLFESDAKRYVKMQENIGNQLAKPWGEFKIEIIPLIEQRSTQ